MVVGGGFHQGGEAVHYQCVPFRCWRVPMLVGGGFYQGGEGFLMYI